MTRRSDQQGASPAGAGALLIGTILTCAAVGLGFGVYFRNLDKLYK